MTTVFQADKWQRGKEAAKCSLAVEKLVEFLDPLVRLIFEECIVKAAHDVLGGGLGYVQLAHEVIPELGGSVLGDASEQPGDVLVFPVDRGQLRSVEETAQLPRASQPCVWRGGVTTVVTWKQEFGGQGLFRTREKGREQASVAELSGVERQAPQHFCVEQPVVSKPAQGPAQQRGSVLHEGLVPFIVSGNVVSARCRAIRTLDKEAEMGLNCGREEDNKRRLLDSIDATGSRLPVFGLAKRDLDGSEWTPVVCGHLARKYQPLFIGHGLSVLLSNNGDLLDVHIYVR